MTERAELEPSPERRNDLWVTAKAFDYGPHQNLELWRDARAFIDALNKMVEGMDVYSQFSNDALVVALSDCYQRADEEVRRAEAELQMREEWAARQPTSTELQP